MDKETKHIMFALFSLLYSLGMYESGLATDEEMRNCLIKARSLLESLYETLKDEME